MADKKMADVGGRKVAGVVKQIAAHGFEKIGDSYAGTYVATKQTQIADSDKPGGVRDATLILLQPDQGDRFGVWSNAVLDDMMTDVPVGTFIEIKHTEVGKPKGKKQGAKLFTITKYE